MEVLRVAIMDYCRRKKGIPFDPSEVAKQMFPEDWELFMEEFLAEIRQMQQEGLIQVIPNANSGETFRIIGSVKPK